MSTQIILSPVNRLAAVMRDAGWEIEFVDLDLTGEHAKAEIKVTRQDGRWLLARVDEIGRASVTRFQRERSLGMSPNTKGRRPLSPQVNDEFLGRSRYEGARSMLRGLTAYLVENAVRPVALADMRAGWATVMGAPTRFAAIAKAPTGTSQGEGTS
jgi:hypothetical protein